MRREKEKEKEKEEEEKTNRIIELKKNLIKSFFQFCLQQKERKKRERKREEKRRKI